MTQAATPRAGAIIAGDDAGCVSGEAVVDMGYQPVPLPSRAGALVTGIIAAALPLLHEPPAAFVAITWRSLTWATVRFAVVWLAAAYATSEAHQVRRLVEPRAAAYPDSSFVRLPSGLLIHCLEEAPPPGSGAGPAVVLVHGFGSAAATCRRAMRPLSRRLGSRVVAFDMPGFGLTERPRCLAHYDAAAVLEGLAAALGLGARGEGLVVVGHSLGGLVGGLVAARPSSPVTALALISPAIVPPQPPAPRRWARAAAAAAACRRVVVAAALYLLQALLGVAEPLVTAALRRAVYRDAFWRQGLAAAYGGGAQPAESTLEEYRRASRVRGWDRGLARFLRFRATGGRSLWALLRAAWRGAGAGECGLVGGLRAAGRPVLILHGAEDPIIPVGNSRSLAAALGAGGGTGGGVSCVLHELQGCGHVPLEQATGDVVDALTAFITSLPPPPPPPPPPSPPPAAGRALAGPAAEPAPAAGPARCQ